MTVLKFFGVLLLGIVIGAGGLLAIGIAYRGLPVSAADTYNVCLQDAKIGMLEHKSDFNWFDNALAKCAKQYRIDRQNGR
jgi:hypothetical protein